MPHFRVIERMVVVFAESASVSLLWERSVWWYYHNSPTSVVVAAAVVVVVVVVAMNGHVNPYWYWYWYWYCY